MPRSVHVRLFLLGLTLFTAIIGTARAADNTALSAGLSVITAEKAKQYVFALADDTFEGREAGSRGGRAASLYVVQQLKKLGLRGGGTKGGYYQSFGNGCSNLLAIIEGSDPELKKQFLLVSAHYDHVGYGSARDSFGPIGLIHNGADDNASGVAGLLEVIEACTLLAEPPRRSILFAFWDGEEKGLLGSKHWAQNPTVPLAQVPLMINADMIGRLRNSRVEVQGVRCGAGMRRLVALQNTNSDLLLDFSWEMKENSDHYTFFARQIPCLMFHTGLHGDYHRPSDDADKINVAGVGTVAQLLFKVVAQFGDEPKLPGFRSASRNESPYTQQEVERPLAALPGRLGVWWDEKTTPDGGLVVTRVIRNSAAERAGIRFGDKIIRFAGQEITTHQAFRSTVLAAASPAAVVVERKGQTEPRELSLQLAGNPVRLGITWRTDDAEPGSVVLNRVVPGSPADLAGLRVNDRVYRVGGLEFRTSDEFRRLVTEATSPLELTVESRGRIQSVELKPFEPPAAAKTETSLEPDSQ